MKPKQPSRANHFPDDVYVGQVASLYADRKSVLMGLLTTGACGCITIAETRSWVTVLAVIGFLLIGAARLHFIDKFEKIHALLTARSAHAWERSYTIGVSAYLAMLGIWTFSVFDASREAFPIIVGLTATISTAFGIPIRNFAFERAIRAQSAAIAVPLFATCVYLGGKYYLFAILVLVPTFVFIKSSAARLRRLLMDELLYRHKSEQTAAQLDMAVNSMSLGLCMLSQAQRVVLANSNIHEMLGLAATETLAGRGIDVVLRYISAKKIFSAADHSRLRDFMCAAANGRPVDILQIESRANCFYDISVSRSVNGDSVVVIQDVTERRTAQRVIDHMAWFDSVTGLPNRRSFEKALHEALLCEDIGRHQTSILFVDLDDFKQVNDTLGHRRGDCFLTAVGERLLSVCGPGRLVARWGGDEFVVLLSDRRPIDVGPVVTSIIRALSQPCLIDGYDIVAGASIGVATTQRGAIAAETLLQQADMALYAAKSSGRGQWRLYADAMNVAAQSRRHLELDVRNSFAAREFELHYQPIVDLKSGEVVSFEALARWTHPERGVVPPSEFIPIIEELGLVNEFGAWVLESACRECASWPRDIRVGVNLSAIQIRSDLTLEKRVLAALESAGLSAKRLELEITESTLLDSGGFAIDTLERLRQHGIRLALDDFGTGFSSLSYLLSFPLDKVKIDRSFVSALSTKGQASILVDSVAKLGAQLGMTVTAEGIETTAQLDFLRALRHVDEGQGYLFSRPLPAKDVWKLLGEELVLRAS